MTETWLSPDSSQCLIESDDLTSFSNVRNSMRGGGSVIFVRNYLHSRRIVQYVTSNNVFNLCATVVG